LIERGKIYFVQLNPTQGREQSGKRPVLVISDNSINNKPLIVTVVVGTNAANITHDYPTNVRVPAKETGLLLNTIFLCFQIRSLDPARFVDSQTKKIVPAGTMPAHRMKEIETALKLVLSIST
jgi:mRNA interferase MazF